MDENYPKLYSKNYTKVSGPKGKEIIDYVKGIGQDHSSEKEEKRIPLETKQKETESVLFPEPISHSNSPRREKTVEELFRHKKPIILADLEEAWRAKKLAKEKALLQEQLLEGSSINQVGLTQTPPLKEPAFSGDYGASEITYGAPEKESKEDLSCELQDLAEAFAKFSEPEPRVAPERSTEPSILEEAVHKPPLERIPLERTLPVTVERFNQSYESYVLPDKKILFEPSPGASEDGDDEDILSKAALIEETLANFGVKAQVTDFSKGPAITRFEIQPAPGVKVSRIVSLIDDLALSLAATDIRIEAPIPGKAAVGIEVPNKEVKPVYLQEIIEDSNFRDHPSKLVVALGKAISGKAVVADLAKMPHMLIAGSTGSGKSVCMNTLISSILYKAKPEEVKFLMIDPKMVELATYNGIPHLIAPVITDAKQATSALKWVVNEMENRYNVFATQGVKNLEGYNQSVSALGEKTLPYVVVLIDELADLMMVASKDVEEAICRLAQKARAAGIHLVIATQRPSVDVITGLIKANIPSRIAFAVSSQIDSRTILDMAGAEKLLGRGDMLFYPIGAPKPQRIQGVFVSDQEVEALVGHVKSLGKPDYLEGITNPEESRGSLELGMEDDELLPEVAQLVVDSGQASVSMLQRRFRIGYTRAARLIDLLQDLGIIGGYEGSKPREVLATEEDIKGLFSKI